MPIIKLLDFGNAIIKNKNIIKSQNFRGTQFYKAPETIGNSIFNEKVDEWAVGIIMYMMLTREEPFKEEDILENKFKKINFEKIENKKLREINEKLLCIDYEKRISAKECVMMLRNIKTNFNELKNKNVLELKSTKIGFYGFG